MTSRAFIRLSRLPFSIQALAIMFPPRTPWLKSWRKTDVGTACSQL